MRQLAKAFLVIGLTLLLAASAAAQSAATAELRVAVRDAKGYAVKNADVTAVNPARNITRTAAEQVDGEYQFLAIPPGQYTITVQAPGFAKTVARDVSITIGQTAEVPVTLQIASVESVVNVSTEAELVETQRSAPTTTIDQEVIQNLPINGRNYINFAETDSKLARDTTPSIGAAPTSGLNFGGQRARANLVNVDGADAVDNSTNGIRSTVSQDAVQEFQIITNGYAAEYGRASGGVVNIITRSGTNAIHGTAYGYLRNRKIQAVNPFSTVSDPAYTRVQTGFTLGGPIKKDRTFYFISYETTRRRETGFSNIGANNFDLVPFDTAPLAPMLGGNNFGTVLLTADQAKFVGQVATAVGVLPPAQQAAILSGGLGQLLGSYLVLAGGSSGIALNGALPSLTMAGAIAQRITGTPLTPPAPVYPGQLPFTSVAPGGACNLASAGGIFPCLSVFPSSGYKLPGAWVPLQSVRGNFPITEGTTLISARLDHRLTNNQQLFLRAGVSPSTVTGIEPQAQGPQVKGLNTFSRTSDNQYRDFNIIAQHSWTIGLNKVNEFRFQYARRGVGYTFSNSPGGSGAGINIPGYAFLGREPFSPVNRVEQRYQFADNFSLSKGRHTFKWGADIHYLPLKADFPVNFGGVYNVGALSAGQLLTDASGNSISTVTLPGAGTLTIPGFSAVQAYGLGIPSYMVQGVGNPHDQFSNKILGAFIQDTWRARSNLTINYGVRYDVELTPTFAPVNATAAAAEKALGVLEGIPRDYNNVAPRIGLAWDPRNNGKTVIRASYGMFYDHPLLALAFDSDVADGSQAPQILLSIATPGWSNQLGLVSCLNATNTFQGVFATCPFANLGGGLSFNYLPDQQRFDGTPNAPHQVFVNQRFLGTTPPVPITLLPFGFPVARNFVYPYSQQANLTIEHDLGHDFAISVEYNFTGGHHLYRPLNVNATHSSALVTNYFRAAAGLNQFKSALGTLAASPSPLAPVAAAVRAGLPSYTSPLAVTACPTLLEAQITQQVTPLAGAAAASAINAMAAANLSPQGNWTSAPLVSFFRPSGLNPSLSTNLPFAACLGEAQAALNEFHLGLGVPIPFSDVTPNVSNGSSVYHGLSVNLRKRMSNHYQFLASYTWSHAIDDSTDLQTTLTPQDSYNTAAERSNSSFDQRHRLVFSAVLQSGKLARQGFMSKMMSDWTFAPIVDISSGRPFNIITGIDRNFDISGTDRPVTVSGPGTNDCGDVAVASKYSPTGWFQPACFIPGPKGSDGTLVGNLGRNSAVKPWTVFTDLRVSRRINITERLGLDAIVDMFNIINRFNVLDVDTLYTSAGRSTSAFDPRQFQLALKLTW